ncbi:MAG: tRNA pseudouridine(55) synthase TruB [Chloroflexi bacterium]|nr:tRNA pseudouridine(55) synthase TruB [Chloroflexota bacterium]
MDPSRTSGILNLDKPRGLTSFDVVGRVRRIAGQRRVGHAGTLDPMATGVLVVCLGQATRVVPYLTDQPKAYQADVTFGVETDTYDAEGQVTGRHDADSLTADRVEQALAGFRGVVEQVPPMYSALKRGGQRLYALARAGVEVDRAPRRVVVHELRLVEWHPPVATLEIRCSKGTYVRSLAHDLGERLGVGAMLSRLVRTASGPFRIAEARTMEAVEAAYRQGWWPEVLAAPDEGLLSWPAMVVGSHTERRLRTGQPIRAASAAADRCRVYSIGGKLVALLRGQGPTWRPETVFAPEEDDAAL